MERSTRVLLATTEFIAGIERPSCGVFVACKRDVCCEPSRRSRTPSGSGTTNRAVRPARCTPTPVPTSRRSPRVGSTRAYMIAARRPNPFPSICGRVCSLRARRLGRRGKIDVPFDPGLEAFRQLSVSASEASPGPTPGTRARAGTRGDGHPSAIVGGGPAASRPPTTSASPAIRSRSTKAKLRLGGMMVLGIPEYRLPRQTIERDRGDPGARHRRRASGAGSVPMFSSRTPESTCRRVRLRRHARGAISTFQDTTSMVSSRLLSSCST